jgi:plasmid replication initiation protein
MSKKKQALVVESDIKLIRKANEFVEARYKFDIWETRVFAYMLTLIKYNDTEFAEYEINVGDIVKEFDLNRGGLVYDEIKKASEKLLSKKVQIERTTPEGVVEILDTYLVVSTARPKEATKDNYIKLSFHSALKPFLIELKQRYLVYDIRNILSLSSIYSIRLFELLKQYQKIGKRRFQIDELKSLLSIEPNEYTLYGHFKDRIIKKAQKDLLEHTDIYFEFEEEAQKKKVFAITFHIFDNEKNQRVKIISVKEEKTLVKTTQKNIDDTVVNAIFGKVNMYVSKLQVKKWVKEIPIEQIENAITYTINYIAAGNRIENIGGFLNTMAHTPNLFDKFEEKKTKIKKIAKKQQDLNSQIEVKRNEIQQVQVSLEKAKQEFEDSLFRKDPTLYQTIISKIQGNQFYDHKKTIEQNLQRDSIIGLRGAILQEMFTDYHTLQKRFERKIKAIEKELEVLIGH